MSNFDRTDNVSALTTYNLFCLQDAVRKGALFEAAMHAGHLARLGTHLTGDAPWVGQENFVKLQALKAGADLFVEVSSLRYLEEGRKEKIIELIGSIDDYLLGCHYSKNEAAKYIVPTFLLLAENNLMEMWWAVRNAYRKLPKGDPCRKFQKQLYGGLQAVPESWYEESWYEEFRQEVRKNLRQRQWTKVVHDLAQMGVRDPDLVDERYCAGETCICKECRTRNSQRLWNENIHLMIEDYLPQIRKVVQKDLRTQDPELEGCGLIMRHEYAKDLLKNFLTTLPNWCWI